MSGRDERRIEKTREEKTYPALKEKFRVALIHCGVRMLDAEFTNIWESILESYRGRAYHNLDHVKYCLNSIEREGFFNFGEREKAIITIALLFHDIAQGGIDAEVRSVDSFGRLLADYIGERLTFEIASCILATDHRDYDPAGSTTLHNAIKDSDLTILGTSWPTYVEYARQIKTEAREAGMDELVYYGTRRLLLSAILAWPKIYQTWDFGCEYEWNARDNLQREIQLIESEMGILR